MKRTVIVAVVAALALSGAAAASQCVLTVDGEDLEFPHVVARTTPNHFDESKENVVIHCFREEIPEDKLSPEEIIWFRPESGRIDVEIQPPDHVSVVEIHSERVTGMVSGMNFGVEFEGKWGGGHVDGAIETTEDLSMLLNGERSPAWRLSATLDLELMSASE